jgi:hypothetical protein
MIVTDSTKELGLKVLKFGMLALFVKNPISRYLEYTILKCYTLLVHGLLTGTEDFSDSFLLDRLDVEPIIAI